MTNGSTSCIMWGRSIGRVQRKKHGADEQNIYYRKMSRIYREKDRERRKENEQTDSEKKIERMR